MLITIVVRNAMGQETDHEVVEISATDDEGQACRNAVTDFMRYTCGGLYPGDTIAVQLA